MRGRKDRSRRSCTRQYAWFMPERGEKGETRRGNEGESSDLCDRVDRFAI